MSAPRIAVVSWSRSEVPGGVFEACRVRGKTLYIVEQGGAFGGRRFRAGELIVCSERVDARHGGVLVPRGRGRVRLGFEQSGRLIGDSGEVCSSERWLIAGGLEVVLRPRLMGDTRSGGRSFSLPTPRGWVVEAWCDTSSSRSVARRHTISRERAQLSLFEPALPLAA